MRFLSAVLFVALTGSVVLADDSAPANNEAKPAETKPEPATAATKRKVPLRVVRMLPETRQVLLFDKTKGTHVVAEVGQDVEGYLVDEIEDDEVTLVSETGAEIILTAPDTSWRRRQAEKKADKKADPAPVDPYADPESAAPTAAPIVAGADGARVVSATEPASEPAPADPYGDPAVAAFFEAVGATQTPSATPAPIAPTKPATKPTPSASNVSSADGATLGALMTGSPAPATSSSAASSAPSPAATGPTTAIIPRSEINTALGDFSGTASTFKATFTPQGLRFDDVVAGSLVAKAGLQKGDVVTTIDGQPLRSLDDAANVYARLPTARGSTIQALRAGKPITLRITIQ